MSISFSYQTKDKELNKINCKKHISHDYIKRYKVKNKIYENDVLICEDCPHVDTCGKTNQCYGKVVVLITEELNKELDIFEEKEKLFLDCFKIDKKTDNIVELNEASDFLKTVDILYQVPDFITNPKVTKPWVYIDRPSDHQTACKKCKAIARDLNTVPECMNQSTNHRCNIQKPLIKYLY